MTLIQPVVEQGRLDLDTHEVLDELLNTLRADDRGQALMQALRLATCGRPVFAASCGGRAEGQSESQACQQGLPAVEASMADEALSALAGLRLVRTWPVGQETAANTYFSADWFLTAVLVLRPFALYGRHDGEWLPATEADEPGEDQARPVPVVPNGWYLVAEAIARPGVPTAGSVGTPRVAYGSSASMLLVTTSPGSSATPTGLTMPARSRAPTAAPAG